MPPKKVKGNSKPAALREPDEDAFEIVFNAVSGNSKKRKRADDLEAHEEPNPWDSRINTNYSVRVKGGVEGNWEGVKRYNKFQVRRHWDPDNPLTLEIGDVVYIESDHGEIAQDGSAESRDDSRFWLAKVMECRAISSANVFLRVLWLYRPKDLPMGRQPYHSDSEVIPSNYMQIIDALTVDGKVDDLQHFDENDDEGQNTRVEDLFWRQTFDCRTNKLSKLRQYCRCKKYANPDVALIQCANVVCKQWMHQECILQDTIVRTYEEKIQQDGEDEMVSNGDKAGLKAEESNDTITVATESPVGKLMSFGNAILRGQSGKGNKSRPAAASEKSEAIDDGSASAIGKATSGDVDKPKTRGRPKSKSSTKGKPGNSGHGEGDLEKASKCFTAQIISARDTKTTTGAASRTKIVEEDDVWIEITDLRSGKGKATWRESISCFFCTEKITSKVAGGGKVEKD